MANLCLHNRDHGMTEALCRGFRTGFLSDTDYHHLTQCESLEDVKMNLAETDYDAFLANEASVSPAVILECATKKMVAEFQFLRAQAVEPLRARCSSSGQLLWVLRWPWPLHASFE